MNNFADLPLFSASDVAKLSVPVVHAQRGEGRMLLDDLGGAIRRASGSAGYRTVLAGDSMTDFNFTVVNPSSVSFNRTTGVLTVTESGGHFKWTGAEINFWNRTYTSSYAMKRVKVASVTSSTVYTVQLSPVEYYDLPNGALSDTTFAVTYQHKCTKSWLSWLNAFGDQRFDIIHNAAQSGDTTSEVLARLDRDVLAWRPNVVVMQAPGINDLTLDVLTSRNNVQRVCINLKQIFDQITQSGAFLICGLLTAVASGEVRAQKNIMAAKDAVNKWIWRYAQANGGMMIVDTDLYIVNPTDTTGLARSGVLSATDFIHYCNVGAFRIADGEKANVFSLFPGRAITLPRSANDNATNTTLSSPTAVVSNGVMTVTATAAYVQTGQEIFIKGATTNWTSLNKRHLVAAASATNSFTVNVGAGVPDGTVTGTLTIWTSRNLFPDPLLQTGTGGTVSNSITNTAVANQLNCYNDAGTALAGATANVAAEGSGWGNEQLLTITAASLNDRPGFKFKNSIGTVDGKMYPGRTYVLEAQLRIASTDWNATLLSEIGFQLNVTANGSTENWRVSDLNQYEAVIPLLAANKTFHLKTAPITIPADTSAINSCQMNIWARYQAAQVSGTLTFGLSRIAVRDVTNDEIAVTSAPSPSLAA